MIQNILDLLKTSSGETDNIQIAQGKYKYPESIREAYEKFKQEIKWSKKQ
jgi:hypothetical protein